VVLFHSRFTLSSLRVQAQIPLGRNTWLIAAGGGGSIGLGFGEIGLRVLMHGNGGPGSFFLSTVVGGVHVFRGCPSDGSCNDGNSVTPRDLGFAGPMLGVGGEWRR
jgi:hypothetical protein